MPENLNSIHANCQVFVGLSVIIIFNISFVITFLYFVKVPILKTKIIKKINPTKPILPIKKQFKN